MTDPSILSAVHSLVDVLDARASRTPDRSAFRFLTDVMADGTVLTYGELDRRARAIAVALMRAGAAGTRVLLVYPPGIDFVCAFLGTLYAGSAAVPVAPLHPGRLEHARSPLLAVVQDAEPAAVLTTAALAERFAELRDRFAGWDRFHTIVTDAPFDGDGPWEPPAIDETTIALLQYTSGSTSTPRGVVVTHGNLLRNAESMRRNFGLGSGDQGVLWLPTHHDMGLIGGLVEPLWAGFEMALMSPLMFLQRPIRWMQAVSRWRATVSGGPNFGYDLAAARITPEQRASLDLRDWRIAFSGAEPIRASTLDRFVDTFTPAGFRRESLHPCYGLAEGTLIVSGSGPIPKPPVLYDADATALEARRARKTSEPASPSRRLVGCGRAVHQQEIAIVNPETCEVCPPGTIGEIWVSGPSIAQRYWNRPEETERVFHAQIVERQAQTRLAEAAGEASHAVAKGEGGACRAVAEGGGGFLRTGDLGFLDDGELFVTGRIKDLIIIDGRNHYPQDIEATTEASHDAVRSLGTAAFSVDDGGRERLVLFVEVERARLRGQGRENATAASGNADIVDAIRRSVTDAHGIPVHDIVFLPPGGVPRTTSGKIQRHRCRLTYTTRALEAEVGGATHA